MYISVEKKKKNFWNRISSHSKLSSIDSDGDLGTDAGSMGHQSQSGMSLDTWSQKTQSSFANGVHLEESPSTQSFMKLTQQYIVVEMYGKTTIYSS